MLIKIVALNVTDLLVEHLHFGQYFTETSVECLTTDPISRKSTGSSRVPCSEVTGKR